MAWSPPAGVVPVDRKSPSVALYADIPAMLDWLRTYYPGHTVVGTLVTARDQRVTYRVDGEPGYGTPGTLSNYTLTKVDWGRAEVDTALADIAQQQAANDQRQQANDQQVAAKLTQLTPLRPAVLPAGTYINGVQAAFAWLGQDDRPMMWMDTAAKWHLDGGLVTDNLAVIKALTLAAATITTLSTSGLAVDSSQRGYVSGVEAVPILADTGGRVALALATDGRLVAPAGIVSPNSVQGITYAASRNRIDGVQAVSGPDLVGIGDSLTHGVGQTPYTTALAGLTGRDVANYGLGGQTSTEIAARFGASTTYLSVAGNTIPASGSVGVTVYDVDLLRTGAGASMAVTLYGVRGTLTRGAGTGVFAGAYTFTRATAGSAVTVPARVQIIPDTSALKERVAIIWIGNNNYAEDANIQRDILAIIRTLEAMKTRYLILTMLNGNYPGRRANDAPNTDYQTMMTINRNMMRLSNNVVDIQKLLPKDPLTDVVDAAYRVDDIHLNSAGYALVAGHIRDALTARGW